MTSWRIVFGLAVAVLVLPALGAAQGLGDVAARARDDRQERAKEPQPVKTFTNDDLPERDPSEDAAEASTGDEDRSRPADRGSSGRERESSGPDEAEVDRVRNRVRRLEALVNELEQKLNPMSTTYVYGGTGGPVGGVQADEERAVRRQLDAARQQLEQAKASQSQTGGRSGSTRGSAEEPAGH